MFEEGGEIRMEEHTNKIVISKRSEDTIEFDTSNFKNHRLIRRNRWNGKRND